MSAWRRLALQKLPECRTAIQAADTVGVLWIQLWLAFEDAYKEPANQGFISRVYDYASWCLAHSNNEDVQTSVIVGFYEHLPSDEKARKDMASHLTREDFFGLNKVMKYHLSEEDYVRLENEFLEQSELRFKGAFAGDDKK